MKAATRLLGIVLALTLSASVVMGAAAKPPKTPKPKQDLQVQKFKITTKSPRAGDTVTVYADVRNNYTQPNPPCLLTIYVDGSEWAAQGVGAIAAKKKIRVSFTGALSSGTHTLEAVIDSAGVVAEKNETNNSRTLVITVLPGLNEATVTGKVVSVTSDEPIPGVTVTIGGLTGVTDRGGNFQIGGVSLTTTRLAVNGRSQLYYSFWARLKGVAYNAECVPLPTLSAGATVDAGTIQLMSYESPPPFPLDCQ